MSIADDNDTDISLEPSSRDDLPVGTFMYYIYLCMSVTVYTCFTANTIASLQRFLLRNSSFSGFVLSDFDDAFKSKYVR